MRIGKMLWSIYWIGINDLTRKTVISMWRQISPYTSLVWIGVHACVIESVHHMT